jgi:murein DD-endopeptidase MepM/ murein hydrolase activator NlpD
MTATKTALWLAAGGLGAYALHRHLSGARSEGLGSTSNTAKKGSAPVWPASVRQDFFVWPVPELVTRITRRPVVTSGYHMRGKRFHWGVDIMYPRDKATESSRLPHGHKRFYMPPGIPALAIADGVVTVSKEFSKGGGVRVDHGNGIKSDYLHLIPRAVKKGERVRLGQRVGTIGYDVSRKIDLYHLHFNLWLAGRKVDPEPYLKRWSHITFEPRRAVA